MKQLNDNLIKAIGCLVIGLLICIFKASILKWMITLVGAIFLLVGIYFLITRDYRFGLGYTIAGVFAILGGWFFIYVLLIIIGLIFTGKGVYDAINSVKERNVLKTVSASLTIFFGVLFIASKWAMLDWIFIVIGLSFIVKGIILLLANHD